MKQLLILSMFINLNTHPLADEQECNKLIKCCARDTIVNDLKAEYSDEDLQSCNINIYNVFRYKLCQGHAIKINEFTEIPVALN